MTPISDRTPESTFNQRKGHLSHHQRLKRRTKTEAKADVQMSFSCVITISEARRRGRRGVAPVEAYGNNKHPPKKKLKEGLFWLTVQGDSLTVSKPQPQQPETASHNAPAVGKQRAANAFPNFPSLSLFHPKLSPWNNAAHIRGGFFFFSIPIVLIQKNLSQNMPRGLFPWQFSISSS